MPQSTKGRLLYIVQIVEKMQDMYTMADVNRYIKNELNRIGGGYWTEGYIGNLRRGKQVKSMGAKFKGAVSKLHASLTKPKPVRSTQNIKVRCTPERATEYREAFTTQERARILDEAMKER